MWRQKAFLSYRFTPPALLDEAGDEHGQGGEEDSGAHSLEEGDAALLAGETVNGGDEKAVVDGDPEGEGQHGEDGERGGGDLEAAVEKMPVGLESLDHHEGGLLHHGYVVDDASGPDWDDS